MWLIQEVGLRKIAKSTTQEIAHEETIANKGDGAR